MNKKMFWIGFVILISGIVITIIGVLGISRLNGFYGLSLYYSNFSLYGEEYTLFSILLYWGIGFIIVGLSAVFISSFPFESINKARVDRVVRVGKKAIVVAVIIGIIFSGYSFYVFDASTHGKLTAKITDDPSGNCFISKSNVTIVYTASVSGGEGPYNYSWDICTPSFVGVSSSYSGQYTPYLTVTYNTYEMNPNNLFSATSPENATVILTVTDALHNEIQQSVVVVLKY
ncbi:MAG: hypothetical protein RE472_03165 [Thermoplasmatales archaeon]|nr:MAG: hypothetical protein RE472_03165 [Thermoplasmatales archaeon]